MGNQCITSACPYCGVGCGINLLIKDNTLIGVEPQRSHPISRGQLCAKGWSSAYGIETSNRITQPLMRHSDSFREIPWDIDSLRQEA